MAWSKKTEKIEVRLSPETKQKFLETCEQQEKSASVVIRDFIEDYVRRLHIPILAKPIELVRKTPMWGKIAAGLAAFTGIASFVALPSMATETLQWEKEFQYKDEDRDGSLIFDELRFKFSNPANPEIAERAQSQTDAMVSQRFEKLDANSDQIVSKQEFREFYYSRRQTEFDGFDRNKDGVVDLLEFMDPSSDRSSVALGLGTEFVVQSPQQAYRPRGMHWAQTGFLFKSLDQNSDSKLDFSEYLEIEVGFGVSKWD